MRKQFAELLHTIMTENENVILLTADLGYGLFDKIRKDFPSRFYNVGASEQLMIGIGVGLTYAGKIPVCYSITPFLLYRPFEMIRNYVNHEKAPVKLIGGGRNKDYAHDGFTHHAEDDTAIMSNFKNITFVKQDDFTGVKDHILSSEPVYINLIRV
jgi:transketolase